MTQSSGKVLTRDEVNVEETWNLEDIFQSDQLWEEEFQQIEQLLERAGSYRGSLRNSPESLYEALQYRDEIVQRVRKLYVYAHLKTDQDTTNSFYQAMENRGKSLYVKVSTALSYFIPEILSIPEDELMELVEKNKKLQMYRHEFTTLNLARPHVLPAEQEQILSQLSEVTSQSTETFGMLSNADLTFPTIKDENGEEVELSHGRYIRFMESKDRRVRKDAFDGLYGRYEEFKNTFASTLSGKVKENNISAKIRNYESARQAALSQNHIPEEVYDNLVETINRHIGLLHRYIALRKEILGLDELQMWDIFAPLVPEVDMTTSYEKATQMMLESFAPLGEEYRAIVQEGLDQRWVDVRENKGKVSGAYSSGTYGTNPYILMNWQDNIDNLFTLAHEFGHSVHSYYSRKHQPFIYSNYSIFVAEVASTVNEAILNDYLLKNTTDEQEKIYLLNHWLDGFRGTVFRQTMFAEFEHLIHQLQQQGIALTAEKLNEEYFKLNQKYYGPAMGNDSTIALEWARIPHFYMNYYVYQYATGYSAAVALSDQILSEGQPAVDRYIQHFLKAGSSDFPIEVLKKAGVDMTTSQPIEEACKVFEKRLNELEALLKK